MPEKKCREQNGPAPARAAPKKDAAVKKEKPDVSYCRGLASCAERAARAAAGHAFSEAHRRTEKLSASRHDVKLALDMESQECAEQAIKQTFPADAVFGEETQGDWDMGRDRTTWIIDPIDGTVNFSHGLPWWCSSVAACRGGATLAAAVCAPALGLCYTAYRGGAACCNGEAIAVSDAAAPGGALVLTGLDKHEEESGISLEKFKALSRAAQKTRILGSAALDICQVASGRADAYYETGIFIWDVAAAMLILENAGGRYAINPAGGGHKISFLGAAPRLFGAIAAILPE